MNENDEVLLSVEQVAKRLGVHKRTVLNWIHSGELVAFDLGKGFKVSKSDLEDFMRRRRTDQRGRSDGDE
ncbi:MAG TPA: helix-turn-helix domain-containing protein [Ktedonobacteraceae bacterium]|nr:helix-turn-helix domain-containing protein [Ktedonobacteraceae bacterium]